MSELNQRYLQLASIVSLKNWREDDTMLKVFTLWVHTQFGLAWQSVLFSAESIPTQVHGSIQKAILFFDNGVLRSMEVETELGRYDIQALQLRPSMLVRIVFIAAEVKVRGLEQDVLDQVLHQQISNQQLNTNSGLHQQLMNDFVFTKRGRSRSSRLIAKMRKDPVLFFRDSKGLFGRSIYYLLHSIGKEKAL